MIKGLINVFKIEDLRKKILFTVALLIIYRIGFHIPCPGFSIDAIRQAVGSRDTDSPWSRAAQYMQIFTGGSLDNSTLFGLGVMPYITASIILMLLGEVVPAIRKLRQEGQVGYRKIQEYTRYLTVPVCIVQAIMYIRILGGQGVVYPGMYGQALLFGIIGMTAGSIFLMWLGEQIDEYGVGNGVSLIIMAGIVDRMPWAIGRLISQVDFRGSGQGIAKLVFLVLAFLFVVAGTILISQAQRRLPLQHAKMVRGYRMYGGQKSYIPLRVNGGGVMPIVFASSFMMFPPIIVDSMRRFWPESRVLMVLYDALHYGSFTYNALYMFFIFVFAYFWVTVQFQPKEWAKNLRDSGSFIPGLRPGKRTADYMETVMMRVTYYGAAFLAAIAIVPTLVSYWLGIDMRVASFLGGTGLLIVVSVSLDVVQKIEAGLLMHSYEGFSQAGRIKGAYT